MSRKEALYWLHLMKWWLVDNNFTATAVQVENVESRLFEGLTPAQCREFAKMILPPGKRGRCWLVLVDPVEARALAMLVGILQSVED